MIESTATATPKTPRHVVAIGIAMLCVALPFSAYLFYLGFAAAPYVYGVWLYAPLALILLFSRFRMIAALVLKPAVGVTCLHGLAIVLGLH